LEIEGVPELLGTCVLREALAEALAATGFFCATRLFAGTAGFLASAGFFAIFCRLKSRMILEI